jgi:probable rRNA maturation factor
MEALVECVIEDDRWESFGLEPLSLKAVRATLAALDLPESGVTVSVMGCDDARISSLNEEFRGKSKPTNVLSWPAWDLAADADGGAPDQPEIGSPEAPESLGDIAISYDTCAREAEEAGKPFADHVTHLVIHGLLHCLGYDHIRDGDAERMEALEVRVLASLGLPDPY